MNVYSITFRKNNGQMVRKTVSEDSPEEAITKAKALVDQGDVMVSLTTDAEGVE